MILLVFNDMFEDGDGFLVAERLELLAVAGDGAALLDLKAAQGHAHAAGAAGQRVGIAAGLAGVDGFRSAQLDDAAVPQSCVFPLSAGQMAQHLGADRIGVALGQGKVGMVALHLGLPVALKGCQYLFQLGAAHRFLGHVSLLAFL